MEKWNPFKKAPKFVTDPATGNPIKQVEDHSVDAAKKEMRQHAEDWRDAA